MIQEKATKMDHKVEHLSIPISHRQQSTPLFGAPGQQKWMDEVRHYGNLLSQQTDNCFFRQ